MTRIDRTSAVLAPTGNEPPCSQNIGPLWSAILLSPSRRRSPIVCESDLIRRHILLVNAENRISGVWRAAL